VRKQVEGSILYATIKLQRFSKNFNYSPVFLLLSEETIERRYLYGRENC